MPSKKDLLLHLEALRASDSKDYATALNCYQRMSVIASPIFFNIGTCHLFLNENERALECFRKCLSLDKYMAVARFQCGVAEFLRANFSNAVAEFKETGELLRGRWDIDYNQLNMPFILMRSEVDFNCGIANFFSGNINEAKLCVRLLRVNQTADDARRNFTLDGVVAILSNNVAHFERNPFKHLLRLPEDAFFGPSSMTWVDGVKASTDTVPRKASGAIIASRSSDAWMSLVQADATPPKATGCAVGSPPSVPIPIVSHTGEMSRSTSKTAEPEEKNESSPRHKPVLQYGDSMPSQTRSRLPSVTDGKQLSIVRRSLFPSLSSSATSPRSTSITPRQLSPPTDRIESQPPETLLSNIMPESQTVVECPSSVHNSVTPRYKAHDVVERPTYSRRIYRSRKTRPCEILRVIHEEREEVDCNLKAGELQDVGLPESSKPGENATSIAVHFGVKLKISQDAPPGEFILKLREKLEQMSSDISEKIQQQQYTLWMETKSRVQFKNRADCESAWSDTFRPTKSAVSVCIEDHSHESTIAD